MSSQKGRRHWLPPKAPVLGRAALVNPRAVLDPLKRTAPLLPIATEPAGRSALPTVVVIDALASSANDNDVPVPEMSVKVPGRFVAMLSCALATVEVASASSGTLENLEVRESVCAM